MPFSYSSSLPHSHGNEAAADFLKDHLNEHQNFLLVADVFKLLGDSSRIKIFWAVCHCEECVTNISSLVGMSSPAVSHHLSKLKAGGLIVSRRDGKEVYYKAADTEQSRLLHLVIEKTMEIACPESESENYRSELSYTIRQIHDYLTENLDKRITIEQLSKEFHINTTTLKEAFKSVYGVSIATHMKEHRMEEAAISLRSTKSPVDEIAKSVGYESQSKFSATFKEYYGLSPLEYRKRNMQ